jgi:hypothetical protein
MDQLGLAQNSLAMLKPAWFGSENTRPTRASMSQHQKTLKTTSTTSFY